MFSNSTTTVPTAECLTSPVLPVSPLSRDPHPHSLLLPFLISTPPAAPLSPGLRHASTLCTRLSRANLSLPPSYRSRDVSPILVLVYLHTYLSTYVHACLENQSTRVDHCREYGWSLTSTDNTTYIALPVLHLSSKLCIHCTVSNSTRPCTSLYLLIYN
ncbi:hypothetical protein F5Y10DRAFT_130068 [Nemania abortiva]|nr:hypothetical protein F5Y10DRAFT_130068 [Nemania abortiva]